ncbi:hypothetical protein [Aquabacter spiritensis]|uniref:hypothetical protein n=1 Tax=Aquabacter spiritensis TaxID=933073 RepID=UPI0010459A17|nr:hypothetical protein [Aquabacter spiritensis]
MVQQSPYFVSREGSTAAHFNVEIVGARSVARLDDLMRSVYRAHTVGHVSDVEVEDLQGRIDVRRLDLSGPRSPRPGMSVVQRVGSLFRPRRRPVSPDRQASRERRRNLGGSGALPDTLRGHFTEGERAVLTIVAGEVKAHGRCTLPLDKIAALAGVGRTTTQNAVHEARRLGLLSVTLRPQKGAKNLPNVFEIISQQWLAWIRRGPKRRVDQCGRIGANPSIHAEKVNPTKRKEEKEESFGETGGGRRPERWRGSALVRTKGGRCGDNTKGRVAS